MLAAAAAASSSEFCSNLINSLLLCTNMRLGYQCIQRQMAGELGPLEIFKGVKSTMILSSLLLVVLINQCPFLVHGPGHVQFHLKQI